MKSIKIKTYSETHNVAVQERLFELGYKWNSEGKNLYGTKKKYLYGGEYGILTHGQLDRTFRQFEGEKVTIDDLYDMEKESEIIELSMAEVAKKLGLQRGQLKIVDK